MKTLSFKIAEIQRAIDGLSKKQENPFFKSKYVDLNQIIDALVPLEVETKISITLPLTNVMGRPAICLRIVDLEEKGEIYETTMMLPDLTDPQKMGSAISYYRRYMLMSFFNLKSEDDDGQLASTPPKKVPTIKELNTKPLSNINEDLDIGF